MADFNLSTNMSLPVPIPGVDAGPDYAFNLNASLSILDAHTHAPGSGIPITPSGLNINGDLPLNANNLTLARTVRLIPQVTVAGASDVGCIAVLGVDLYYRDVNSNLIRITQSGGIAGSPGTIANLVSPASASYVAANSTFVWQSAANVAATMDMGNAILRNLAVGSFGVTLAPPTSLSANYTITMPLTPPSGPQPLIMDASGNLAAQQIVQTQISNQAVGTAQIQLNAVTPAQRNAMTPASIVSAGGLGSQVQSPTSVIQNGVGTSSLGVSIVITTTGRPVQIALVEGNWTAAAYIGSPPSSYDVAINLLRNGTLITSVEYAETLSTATAFQSATVSPNDGSPNPGTAYGGTSITSSANWPISITPINLQIGLSRQFPAPGVILLDPVVAGTYTYTLTARVISGSQLRVNNMRLVIYEI